MKKKKKKRKKKNPSFPSQSLPSSLPPPLPPPTPCLQSLPSSIGLFKTQTLIPDLLAWQVCRLDNLELDIFVNSSRLAFLMATGPLYL